MFDKKIIYDEEIEKFTAENIGKQIVIFYGNCHTTAMAYKLKQNYAFSEKYVIFPFKAIQDIKNSEYLNSKILSKCDVFIHQAIQKNNRYGIEFSSDEMIKKLRESCLVISIPNLYHLPMCFFPQYLEYPEYRDRKGNTCFFGDAIIETYYKDNKLCKSNDLIYCKEGVFSKSFLLDKFEDFIDKIMEREKEWDIKILEFILDNYKKRKLFYDPNHPTPVIINKIVDGILERLNIICNSDDSDDFLLDTYEMPICKDVIQVFQIEYINHELRKNGRKICGRPMKLNDYINQYLAMEWQNKNLDFKKRVRSFFAFLEFKRQNLIKK